MFFKLVYDGDGYYRVQVTIGKMRRSFTVKQFMAKVTDILNKLGYEVKKKSSSSNDAVEFFKAFGCMCESYKLCKGCPINESDIECNYEGLGENAETIYEVVDRWARENKN